MRVFLDTNILLDIIEGRQQFLLASSNVFDLGIRGLKEMFATPLTFANCVYTARKMPDFEDMLQYEAALADKCDVIVTRDKKRHVPIDGLSVLSPEVFLNTYFGN